MNIDPNVPFRSNVSAKLSKVKSIKVMKTCDGIMTFISTLLPALGQVLLSYSTYHKRPVQIPSLMIYINWDRDILYRNRFNEDKWAEWSSNHPPIITSNINKAITTTLLVENIDRKNKDLDFPETHNTNSILNQNCSDDLEFSQSVNIRDNSDNNFP